MTHLHLSRYRLLGAKYTLLRASQTLDARPADEADEQAALGHDARELLMRILHHWHGSPLRILRCDCAPYAGPLLPGAPTPLPAGAAAESLASLEATSAAAMGAGSTGESGPLGGATAQAWPGLPGRTRAAIRWLWALERSACAAQVSMGGCGGPRGSRQRTPTLAA